MMDYIDYFWLLLNRNSLIFAEEEGIIREFIAQEMDIMKRNYKSRIPFLADVIQVDNNHGGDNIRFNIDMPGVKGWYTFKKEREVNIREEAEDEQAY